MMHDAGIAFRRMIGATLCLVFVGCGAVSSPGPGRPPENVTVKVPQDAPVKSAAAPAAEGAPQVTRPAGPGATPERTTIRIPAQNPVGIAAMSGRMWVTDAGTGEVLELNPSTGGLIGKFKLELKQPKGLAFDGQHLWVADQATRQIVAYNVADGRRVKAIPIRWPDEKETHRLEALGWDGKWLWTVLVGNVSPTFNQVDPESGRIVRSISAGCDPRGVAFNSSLLFGLCINGYRELAAVDQRQVASPEPEMLKTRRVVQVLAASAASGLTYDGTKLWVLDAKMKRAITVRVDQAQPPPRQQQTPVCDMIVFPEVSWNVCLYWAGYKGVWIASADIQRKKGLNEPWIRVLSESGPVEILTTYHGTAPHGTAALAQHLFDMNQWSCVATVNAQDAAFGSLFQPIPMAYPPNRCPQTLQPNVVRELRDRGIANLCKDSTSSIRRGQEVVYWSVYDPGSYNFIVEYGFRDDGRITFRMGATGHNNGDRPLDPHMHSALWRINADIDGVTNNVFLEKHVEPSPPMTLAVPISLAADSSQPVTYESFFDFDPLAFTTLRVEATTTTHNTSSGNPIGYVLEPLVQGSSRHYNILPPPPKSNDAGEVFAQHDFAVTKSNPGELATTIGDPYDPNSDLRPDEYLLPQLGYFGTGQAPESLTNEDVILWYRSSVHHVPSDEDRPDPTKAAGLTSPGDGITQVHWMGFDFVPHNFFDYNPLGGPRSCGAWCGNGVCDPKEDGCTCPADCCAGGVNCC